jgi:hypothetical protein
VSSGPAHTRTHARTHTHTHTHTHTQAALVDGRMLAEQGCLGAAGGGGDLTRGPCGGRYLLGFAYVNIMLGFWLKMNFAAEGWQWPLKVALTSLTAGLLGFLVLPPPAQMQQPVGSNDVD